jgi:alkanesulfonate monooxygenase SsuD/methylene tetrahydromethanopterin reductase-like flavin-dependent oxidoreductase (luciferase family)
VEEGHDHDNRTSECYSFISLYETNTIGYYAGRVSIGSTDAGSASPEATAEVNLFGTPAEVVDRIEMLREDFSTDEIMFEVNWTASVPRKVVMNTMQLLTDKVIPKFK